MFTEARFTRTLLCLALFSPGTALSAEAAPRGEEIPTIEITDRRPTHADDELQSLKLPGNRRTLPISVETLGRGLMAQSSNHDLASLMRAATSAVVVATESSSTLDVIVRGFGNTPFYRNGINDSLGQLGPRSLYNIDHIEVLKGPTSALFGPGEPGGSINVVTKRPRASRELEIGNGYGRYGQFALDVDATGAIPLHDEWQYRLIGAREQGDTFRDFVKLDRWFAAPSIAWQPRAGTDILASVEYVRDQRLADAGIFIAHGQPRPSRGTFLGEPALGPSINDSLTGQLSINVELERDWDFEFQVQGQRTRLDGVTLEPSGFVGSLLEREALARDELAKSWAAQLEVNGPLKILNMNHDLVFGVEAIRVREDVALSNSDTDVEPFAIDPVHPRYGTPLPALALERQSRENRKQHSVYARDRVTLSRHWRLLIGARLDHIDQSGLDTVIARRFDNINLKLSPHVSLIHNADNGIVTYASYSQSMDPNEGLQPDGKSLSPTLGKSLETGFRWASADEITAIDVALFGIRQGNVAVDAPGRPGFEVQTADQEHIGIDLEIALKPTPALAVQMRYNWLDTKITNDPVVPDGTRALNIPGHQAGLLATYATSLLTANDLSLGLALRFLGERQASLDPSELDLELDGYVSVDVFLRLRLSRHLHAGLTFENIGDEDYIQGSQSDAFSLSPGTPFGVRGEIRIRF